MVQADPTRLEEYLSLRQEMLSLFLHGRDVLYWTIGFVILALGWYAAQSEVRKLIVPYVFTLFLLGVLILSAITYSVAMGQAYRIGSYIAVFWESGDLDRWLRWHRFNRHGPVGGFLANSGVSVYVSASLFVMFFFGVFVYAGEVPITFVVSVSVLGLAAVRGFPYFVGTRLRDRRMDFEQGWRLIAGSPARQAQIHALYDVASPTL